ncbi:WD repeat-containing protein 4 [Dinochytrium kinnereticum]|nr:WD repeat-containing protein 4 [Dinochytrium kinnereticum]
MEASAWLPFRRAFCHPHRPLIVLFYGNRFLAIRSSDASVVAGPDDNPLTSKPEAHVIKAEDFPGADIKAASFHGDLMVVCSEDKLLSVWNVAEWKLVFKTETPKRVNVVQFSPCGKHVVVGDKFGDVYSFSLENTAAVSPPTLLLGHVSLITDMIFSNDGKFLITSDRDEKVRITNYPLTFDIQAFCLGHKLFVTAVAPVPNSDTMIVSGGGDPYLLVWDILSGERIQKLSWTDTLTASEQEQDDLLVLAVKSCPKSQTIAVLINGVKGVLLFNTRTGSHLVFKERVNLPEEAFDIAFDCNGNIWGVYMGVESGALLFTMTLERDKYVLQSNHASLALSKIQSMQVDSVPDYLIDVHLLKKLSEEELQERRKARKERNIEEKEKKMAEEKERKSAEAEKRKQEGSEPKTKKTKLDKTSTD